MLDSLTNIYTNIDALRRLKVHGRGFSFHSRQPANSVLAGKYVSKLRGRGLNFEELRHYRPGDDIRCMDWKVTRRTGKPHIKVYTEERERNIYLIIDQRSSMFFGSQKKMKSVVAAEIAALIAWQSISVGDRVGAVIFNDVTSSVITAKRSIQHITQLLNEVVKFNQQLSINNIEVNDGMLNQALHRLANICGTNSLIIYIGDGSGWNEHSNELVKRLRQHHELVACDVFDPLERSLPKMSNMVVSDGQLQIQFTSDDKPTQQKYDQLVAQKLGNIELMAKKYRIPLISIDTLSPVEKQLQKALGRVAV